MLLSKDCVVFKDGDQQHRDATMQGSDASRSPAAIDGTV